MKKFINFVILLSILSCSAIAHAQSVEETDPGFVILDVMLYRPVGLAVTIIGTAAFIGLSPLTALASIPEPHDAFVKTSKILIFAPGAYTFIRPVGNRDVPYYVPPYKHQPVATQNYAEPYKKTVKTEQSPVTPVISNVEPQKRYPDSGSGL